MACGGLESATFHLLVLCFSHYTAHDSHPQLSTVQHFNKINFIPISFSLCSMCVRRDEIFY